MIEIDAQPTTNPLDVPTPKPSEIVRNWPDAMWGRGFAKRCNQTTGAVSFCAIGIDNEMNEYEWGAPESIICDRGEFIDVWLGGIGSRALRSFIERHGILQTYADRLTDANDSRGKEAAADYLESLGL